MSNAPSNVDSWIGRQVVDQRGDQIGKVSDLYVDDDSGQPTWLAVSDESTRTARFIPLAGAESSGDRVVVAYDKATVTSAPTIDADEHFSDEEEAALYRHYGRDNGDNERTEGEDRQRAGEGGETDEAMTRSEEQLDVNKRRRETGRARLRKWVETENVQITVPVEREKARLVTEPITDENVDAAMSGPELSEDEHEVVLHEEEIDVQKRVVPKERVRLETETVTDQVDVDEGVRKERIDFERDDPDNQRG